MITKHYAENRIPFRGGSRFSEKKYTFGSKIGNL
jgi:hypothetical protein